MNEHPHTVWGIRTAYVVLVPMWGYIAAVEHAPLAGIMCGLCIWRAYHWWVKR